MYAYIDAFKKSEKQREEMKKNNYFFENKEYWDLDSPYLSNLQNFLLTNLDNTDFDKPIEGNFPLSPSVT